MPGGVHARSCSSTRHRQAAGLRGRPPVRPVGRRARAWWRPGPRRSSQYGSTSFGADLQPAIGVAQRGFPVDENFNQQEQESLPDLQSFTSSRKLFLTTDGQPLPVGTQLRNPDLARTYTQLAKHGPGYLYGGALGADIAHTVQHPPVSRARATSRSARGS